MNKPLPWWEEYLGLKIRFPQVLKPKRVWMTLGYYAVWIVPGALVSMLASWAGWQAPVTQARTKEVHVASENLHGIVTSEGGVLDQALVSGDPLSVNVSDSIQVSDYERVTFVKTFSPSSTTNTDT